MRNAVFALLASLALHACLAAALAVCLSRGSVPDVAVSLDLSHVELSFAEQEDLSAPAAAPSARDTPPPAKPPSPPKPPDAAPVAGDVSLPLPPEIASAPPLEPEEPPEAMETPASPAETAAEPHQPPAPSSAAPRQAKLTAPPRPRTSIRPDYPKGARQRGEQGEVVLEISVSADGTVGGVSVVSSSGFPELDEAAVRAARRARFTPAKADGRPVASTARLTLSFQLK